MTVDAEGKKDTYFLYLLGQSSVPIIGPSYGRNPNGLAMQLAGTLTCQGGSPEVLVRPDLLIALGLLSLRGPYG